MLDLDSDRWSQLEHAYGSAADIPALLRALPSATVRSLDSEQEPWFTLWSALCHQSDVYTASFAALPHIVAAAQQRQPIDRTEYLLLAGSIESMRHKRKAPRVDAEFEPAYTSARTLAVPLCLEALRIETRESWFQGLLSALCSFRGFPKLGAGVSDLEREIGCPSCHAVFVARGFDYFE